MPPPSPVPGWASGEVCMERTARLRTVGTDPTGDWSLPGWGVPGHGSARPDQPGVGSPAWPERRDAVAAVERRAGAWAGGAGAGGPWAGGAGAVAAGGAV